jgi:glycosyltransferase involved in cell wall biosynthesis
MKIVLLSNRRHAAASTEAGSNPHLLQTCLAAEGFIVKRRELNGIKLNPLAKCGTFYAGFDVVRATLVLLWDRKADVIVSVGESNIVLILLLGRLLRFKPRIVLREVSHPGWTMRDKVVAFVLPKVDLVLTLTQHHTAWVERNYRLKNRPVCAGFAIDEGFFQPRGLADGNYILAVGDDCGRDYPTLIAACRDTPYHLVLRTDSCPAIPEDMRTRVSVMGRLSNVELRDLYEAATVVVVPLIEVDHPSGITTLFEAMALGCAVVASNNGTAREFIKDGENGILTPVGEPQALRNAVARLMNDTQLRLRLGRMARKRIEDHFSYAAYVQRFAAGLRSALAQGSFRVCRHSPG